MPGGLAIVPDLLEDLGMRVASKWLATREELIKHNAQAEDIRTAIDPVSFASGLLGTHVRRGADKRIVFAGILVP
jgi:hypothetical protein